MKHILVTGGAGFIGSHTSLLLLKRGFNLSIIDSYINSNSISIERIKQFLLQSGFSIDERIKIYKGDLRNKIMIEEVFEKSLADKKPIDGVIHFAGLKSVLESQINPLLYWDVNLQSSINLFEVMSRFNCNTIVFSSSATIYNAFDNSLIIETHPIKPLNTYGRTKEVIEIILNDIFNSVPNKWRIANLRYFNPIGAHPSGLLGEDPKGIPNNIFPLINQVALGKIKHIKIFGNNWPTRDGTGVRDYIHVMDLAFGHLLVLEKLLNDTPKLIDLNIGTGLGTSVLELIKIFEKVNNIKIPYIFDGRRSGDAAVVVADNTKIINFLDWKPEKTIEDMCRDGWNWQLKNPEGFK